MFVELKFGSTKYVIYLLLKIVVQSLLLFKTLYYSIILMMYSSPHDFPQLPSSSFWLYLMVCMV